MSRSPAEQLALAPEADRAAFVESLTDAELLALMSDWETFLARPEQIPPAQSARWWALLTGRGFGKNRTASEWFVKRCEQFADHRWPHSAAMIGQTYDDVSAVQIHGESGIEAVCDRKGYRLEHAGTSLHGKLRINRAGYTHVTEIELHTAEKPDKVRGRNLHTAHADELAAWTHRVDQAGGSAWSNLDFSLRAECPPGLQPMGCVTTTPKPIPQVRDITSGKLGGGVVVTRGSLYDNVSNLAPEFVAAMAARYTGTRLAEQEIYGKVLDFVEGALWTPDLIQTHRVYPERGDYVPTFRRVVIGVDPSGSDGGDECGIVAVGLSAEPIPTMLGSGLVVQMNHVYVLRDLSCRLRPALWVPKVVELYHELAADSVVAEVNFGAALVTDSIHMVDPNVKVREVRASRGKAVRAEPVAMVYDQGRAHHVGQVFPQLEEQMATWVPTDKESPDRMDALVWAVTELLPEITRPPSRDVSPSRVVQSLPTGADGGPALRPRCVGTVAGMLMDYQAPVVATVTYPAPDGGDPEVMVKTVHLTVGPATDDPERQETVLWAWSAAAKDGYAWHRTGNPPIPQGGAQTRWTLDLGGGVTAKLARRASAWCCGDPFKRWRPPGQEAPRRRSVR